MENEKWLKVRLGGSNRKLEKQMYAFKEANIPVTFGGSITGVHHSNMHAAIPDTPEARALLKKVGGSTPREPNWVKEAKQSALQKRMV
jgi:hypothetical protein